MDHYREGTHRDNQTPRFEEGVSGLVPANTAAVIEAQRREAEFWTWRALVAARQRGRW